MERRETVAMRREALVQAAISEIGEAGSLDVTVWQIAKRAGVSSALAHHYFGSKDQILAAAMRQILVNFGDHVRSGLRASRTPRERLASIVRASFASENFQQEVISAWLNFYVSALASHAARRMLAIYQRRLRSNLAHDFRSLVGPESADFAAGTIAALIDGLYIREALRSGRIDGKTAERQINSCIDILISGSNRT